MIRFISRLIILLSATSIYATSPIYETYLESWDPKWYTALTNLSPTPSTSPSSYNNVTLNIAFASYDFPGLNGVQFSTPSTDTQTVINYVHGQNGKVKISYGGASYAQGYYFISQTPGWPSNMSQLVEGISEVVNSYGFDGVDFDIEDNIEKEKEAKFASDVFEFLRRMRVALPEKIISLTIPGQAWGRYWEILAQKVANSPGTVNYINFMEYDLWIGAPTYSSQIQADIITYTSPTNTSPPPNYSPGWGIPAEMIQLGLMPGYNDKEQFLSIDDAQNLTKFAVANHLFGVMTWDIDRDAGTNPVPPLEGATPYEYSNTIRSALYTASLSNTTLFRKYKMNKVKKRLSTKKSRKIKGKFVPQTPPLHGAP